MIQDLASLLWVINLGCIDLNQWYARCDDVDRPDYLHFDLDPVPGATFEQVRRDRAGCARGLESLKMPPLRQRPPARRAFTFTCRSCAGRRRNRCGRSPKSSRSVLARRIRSSDHGRLPHRQAAEGPRAGRLQPERLGPHARFDLFGSADAEATVSTPVTWKEVENGHEDRRLSHRQCAGSRQTLGDFWKPLLAKRGRFKLEVYL